VTRFSAAIALAGAAVIATASPPAAAQSTADERAIALGHEALVRFEAGDCPGATARFQEADRLVHSPVFSLYIARCRRKDGDLVGARDLYQRVAAEPLADTAPEPFRKARSDATAELVALEPHIPGISVVVRSPRLDDVTITLDGAPVAIAALARPLRVNPGPHRISAERPGEARIDREIQLSEDRVEAIEIAFAGAPVPIAPVASVAAAPVTPPRREGSLVPGLATLGLAGVALAVGGIGGAIAKLDETAVINRCTGSNHNLCLTSDIGERNTAITLAAVSTGGFLAGGLLAAAGVVLVIVRPGGGSSSNGVGVSVGVAPNRLSLRATF
jgi:hypothetical protein